MEHVVVTGIASNNDEAKVSIRHVPDKPGVASQIFQRIADEGIVVDMIIQNLSAEGHTDMTFTVPKSDLDKAIKTVKALTKEIGAGSIEADPNICKISAIGVGMRTHTGVASKMFKALADERINIMLISTSEIKISCVIDAKYSELAVRALHDAFGLEQEPIGC
jgi:aspartate kinase